MSCPCNNSIAAASEDGSGAKPATDRYVSFIGLDCDAKAREMMSHVRRYIDDPQHTNAFWEYFKKKSLGGSGPRPDDLFLIHSNLNQIRELFELHADEKALSLLDRIEQECC